MKNGVGIEDLRQARRLLRGAFVQMDSRLLRLFDEPFMEEKFFDVLSRLLEYRTEVRGIIVGVRNDMFDAYFHDVGIDDEVRMLTIETPLPITANSEKISAACLGWMIDGQSEQAVSELLEEGGSPVS